MKLPIRYYVPTPLLAVHYVLFAAIMIGFLLRSSDYFWAGLPLVGNLAIGTHFSNFALSYVILAGGGLWGVLTGGPIRNFILLAGLLAVANVVYELLIPLINTRDGVDALYGLAGTALGLGILLLCNRYKRPTA